MPLGTPDHDAAEDVHASFERHPVEDIEPLAERCDEAAALAETLKTLLLWILEPRQTNFSMSRRKVKQRVGFCPRNSMVRLCAFLYTLRPDLLPDEFGYTIAEKIGVTKQAFSHQVREFHRAFGFHSPVMRSESACERMREAALQRKR